LFDHLVGNSEQFIRHVEAERLGGFQVDDELELGRLHNWHVRRARALEDLTDILAGLSIHPADARAIAQEATHPCQLTYKTHQPLRTDVQNLRPGACAGWRTRRSARVDPAESDRWR